MQLVHLLTNAAKEILLGPGLLIALAGAVFCGFYFAKPKAIWPRLLQGVLVLLLFALFTPWTADLLAGPVLSQTQELERHRTDPECLNSFTVVVVLGGGLVSAELPTSAAQERLLKASVLLRELSGRGKSRAIVLTGGPTLPGSTATEADAALSFMRGAMSSDFNKHRFLTEGNSFNTHDNATRTYDLLRKEGLPFDIILVTSALHMPRSLATFKAAGFQVCPLAVWPENYTPILAFENAIRWKMILNEVIGIWVYRVLGWI